MSASDIRELSGVAAPRVDSRTLTPQQTERFHALYRDHFDFVFRNLRRLGVAEEALDDALQEVYLVVLRHIDSYRDGTYPKAWLFAIVHRIASNRRRAQRRRGRPAELLEEGLADPRQDPFDDAARAQATQLLHAFLDTLDEDKRSVFVMAELEQMTAPEIARALSANVNTVYGRLRAARIEFSRLVEQQRARRERTDG